ncbi:MAG: CxxC-x17-CxxC domain-containing protein, partial [Patescibacteria group bacterium]|nr:CxxC-x17-CxxC domain-containing protein [Patescibacteria group bacterium]
ESAQTRNRESAREQIQQLYDAQCAKCGRKIKIPFEPRPNQQVYCKTCKREISDDKPTRQKSAEKFVSLKQAIENKVVPFFLPKNKKKVKREKKEIDIKGLDQLLKDTLDKEKTANVKTDENKVKKGIIKPGDTIKF